jgi:hypothetical protein
VSSVVREFAGGCFEAGREVVVVVVDVVGIVDGADGGCASVISGDVAGDGEGRGVGMVQLGFGWYGLGGSVDVPTFLSERSGSSLSTVCVMASAVVVFVWVVKSMLM